MENVYWLWPAVGTRRRDVSASDPRPVVGEKEARHVLDGEPGDERKGGHRHGVNRVGKTEFPLAWTDEDVMKAVRSTLRFPDWSVLRGDRRTLRKMVVLKEHRVMVEAQYYHRHGQIIFRTAYPVMGDGVFLNLDRNVRVEVPLRLERGTGGQHG